MLKNKYVLLLLLILSLPILLPLYNPAVQWGWIGMLIGGIGMFVSPVVIFGTFIYWVVQAFRQEQE